MIVAIHQPNFLPWPGFFEKMLACDTFILLDSVPHTRTGSNWTNRTYMKDGVRLTLPVERKTKGRICDMKIAPSFRWAKMRRTVDQLYAKAESLNVGLDIIHRMEAAGPGIVGVNIAGIDELLYRFGMIFGLVVKASTLGALGTKTELLVNLVKAVGGDTYLAGAGAAYQDNVLFEQAGIAVKTMPPRPPAPSMLHFLMTGEPWR